MNSHELDLLIKGDLVLKTTLAHNYWVGVKDGVIIGIYSKRPCLRAKEIIEASGHLVFPGIIDTHVHSYSYPSEGFENSTLSAAAGGVTTIIEMPYDAPEPTTSVETFQKKIKLIRKKARVDVALLATLKKDAQPEMIRPLLENGACGFKLSIFETDPNRFPRIEDDILWKIMPIIAENGATVGFHAENDRIIKSLINDYRHLNKTYPLAHFETRPPVTETLAVVKLLELAHWTKAKLHIFHASHPRSVELINWYKYQGTNVTVETCPHYLLLEKDDMERLKAFAKINPCLREKNDVSSMWKHIQSGDIDIIASDHAPWPLEKKLKHDIFENASGAPGLQTLFPLLYSEGVVKRNLSVFQLAKLLSENPAKRFNLFPQKGNIDIGADGDFTILDPSKKWTVHGSENLCSVKWTPYENLEVVGKIAHTVLRGVTIFDGDSVLASERMGRFINAYK